MLTHQNPSPVDPSRVVVLGASGFVGQNLMQHLSGWGIETVGLSSSDIDLCSPDSAGQLGRLVFQDDVLVFVSAITPDKGRDIRTLMRNLTMAESVCSFLAENPPAHVVYVGSDAVYQDDIALVKQSSCCDPGSFHGLMHLAREKMLVQTLRQSQTPLALLRPSLLYGEGDTHNGYGPNRFMRAALDGTKITLFGNGEEKRDHVFIGDLSRLIGLCISHRSAGALNVATGTSTPFIDVAKAVVKTSGKPAEIECTPRQNPITHRHFDIAATMVAFPAFQPTTLEDGLDRSIELMAGTWG